MTGLWRTGPFLGIAWFSSGEDLRPVSRRRLSMARWARRRRAARFLLGIHTLHPVAATRQDAVARLPGGRPGARRSYLAFFVPYLERLDLRSRVPEASRAPRTMW